MIAETNFEIQFKNKIFGKMYTDITHIIYDQICNRFVIELGSNIPDRFRSQIASQLLNDHE